MKISKLGIIALGVVAMSVHQAHAGEYPAELHGAWAMDLAYCPDMTVDKDYAQMGTEQSCQAKKVRATGQQAWLITELCQHEEGSGTESTRYQYHADSDTLTRSFRQFSHRYQRCPMTPVAEPRAENQHSTSASMCVIQEGQAGVTTFLDAALVQTGREIRAWDGYAFYPRTALMVKGAAVWSGELRAANGQLLEQSYILADEWQCSP